MGLGASLRRRLGRFEIPIANLYRGAFVNLGALATRISRVAPAQRILEVGCGDGFLAQELVGVYPDARYLGIDVVDTAGRLYRGDPAWASFRTVTVQDLHAEAPEPFDLVVFADVIHHVPLRIRGEVLRAAAELVRPGGHLVVKEFERNRGPYYHVTFVADRYVTGDRTVRFMTMPQLRELIGRTREYGFADPTMFRVGPARNNVVFALRRHAAGAGPTTRLSIP
jgi:2-polyprenyl-3-methyl-5-hydroxy-6-metoxy-1,4-benzoquinol methylase